jgi:PAS domain S-box-containing protein
MNDEQQIQREMAAEEQFFRDVFRTAADAIVTVGRDRRIERVNDQAVILTEYARVELVGQPVAILVPKWKEDHDQEVDKTFAKPAQRQMGFAETIKTAILSKQGREVPVTIYLNPVVHEIKGLLIVATIRRRDE